MANRLSQAGPRALASSSTTSQPEGYHANAGAATVTPDLANGWFHQVTLDRSTTTLAAPIYTGGTVAAGMRLAIKLLLDATSGRQVAWNAIYKGVSAFEISTVASTYSTFWFIYDGTYWQMAAHPVIGVSA